MIEGIGEALADVPRRDMLGPNGNAGLLEHVELAQLVETCGMVGVSVGIKDSVDPGGARAQELRAQIR